MNDRPAIPSSVDMSGDISRNQSKPPRNTNHERDVGEAIGGKDYRPGMHQHQNEGNANDPLECALVLGTPADEGSTIEFRIGKFRSIHDLKSGLSSPTVVRGCFDQSDIYTDRGMAITHAELLYKKNHGIKVLCRTRPFREMRQL
jgi:hypothetical protein